MLEVLDTHELHLRLVPRLKFELPIGSGLLNKGECPPRLSW